MKKYFLNSNEQFHNISSSLANALNESGLNFQSYVKDRNIVFLLHETNISYFQLVPTVSLSHFNVLFLGKKYRVSSSLYSFFISTLSSVNTVPEKLIKTVVSPLTWVGNKSKNCESIFATIPNSITNYHEPFLGSAAVLFHVLQEQIKGNLKIKNAINVSDLNEDLINFFKIIQQAPEELYYIFMKKLVLQYDSLESDDDKSRFFYDVRANFNSNLGTLSTTQSARFLFLNKTCYGGLFRTNSSGLFNVPFGHRKNPKFLTKSSLLSINGIIKNVYFSHRTFNPQLTNYEEGDFFYFDPPYVKMTKLSFVNYLPSGFSDDDFVNL
jgi:DNA adenine methylase